MDYPDSLLRRVLMYPFVGFDLLPHLVISLLNCFHIGPGPGFACSEKEGQRDL